MKITVSVERLQKTLTLLNHAISSKSQLAILTHILINATEKYVILKATDLEIGIEIKVQAEVQEEGSVAVPARTFIELINSLPLESLELIQDEATLLVKSKRTTSVFQTTPASDFPKLYEEKGELVAIIDSNTINRDFGSVIFSATSDTTRPALSGVLLKKNEGGLLLVATDGYRLSLRQHRFTEEEEMNTTSDDQMIVPARVFREVIAAKNDSGVVSVFASKERNQILFELGGTLIVGRLIEAEFPNYAKIIPSDFSARTFFDREELLKAVKICSIFARDAANIIKLSLRSDKIIVSSQTPSLGKNSVDVDAALSGEENEIAFNARYLQDILSNLDTDDMSFEMTGPLNPGVFKIKDNESYLHLIMPIRLTE